LKTEEIMAKKIRKTYSEIRAYFRNLLENYKKKNLFQEQFCKYKIENDKVGRFQIKWIERFPCLYDDTQNVGFERHYMFHPVWAASAIKKISPDVHYDISSSLRFVSMLSCFFKVKHFDYRKPPMFLENLEIGQVNLTGLDFTTNSIFSLSCMHTIEHIGLGRYGDALDCDGDIKAANELKRVLAKGGNLLVVVPVGRSRIEFNAHRIYSFSQAVDLFSELTLVEYALIPDNHETGDIIYGASEALTDSQEHGCGCFWFKKE
jgi:hypothetical protein